MPVMTDTVTNELLAEVVERFYTVDGCNYNAENRRQIAPRHEKLRDFRLATSERDTITFADYLRIEEDNDAIKEYCITYGVPSLLAPLYRDFIILTRNLDPNADVSSLEALRAIAAKENQEREAVGREEKAVPFSHFNKIANDTALKIMAHGLPDHELSKLVLASTEIVLCSGRANMLSCMRYASAADFDPAVQHTQEKLDELCSQ
eukprot:COSAG02_NODE_7431_length_3015_cov_11.776406_1_plen_205_part_10